MERVFQTSTHQTADAVQVSLEETNSTTPNLKFNLAKIRPFVQMTN